MATQERNLFSSLQQLRSSDGRAMTSSVASTYKSFETNQNKRHDVIELEPCRQPSSNDRRQSANGRQQSADGRQQSADGRRQSAEGSLSAVRAADNGHSVTTTSDNLGTTASETTPTSQNTFLSIARKQERKFLKSNYGLGASGALKTAFKVMISPAVVQRVKTRFEEERSRGLSASNPITLHDAPFDAAATMPFDPQQYDWPNYHDEQSALPPPPPFPFASQRTGDTSQRSYSVGSDECDETDVTHQQDAVKRPPMMSRDMPRAPGPRFQRPPFWNNAPRMPRDVGMSSVRAVAPRHDNAAARRGSRDDPGSIKSLLEINVRPTRVFTPADETEDSEDHQQDGDHDEQDELPPFPVAPRPNQPARRFRGAPAMLPRRFDPAFAPDDGAPLCGDYFNENDPRCYRSMSRPFRGRYMQMMRRFQGRGGPRPNMRRPDMSDAQTEEFYGDDDMSSAADDAQAQHDVFMRRRRSKLQHHQQRQRSRPNLDDDVPAADPACNDPADDVIDRSAKPFSQIAESMRRRQNFPDYGNFDRRRFMMQQQMRRREFLERSLRRHRPFGKRGRASTEHETSFDYSADQDEPHDYGGESTASFQACNLRPCYRIVSTARVSIFSLCSLSLIPCSYMISVDHNLRTKLILVALRCSSCPHAVESGTNPHDASNR